MSNWKEVVGDLYIKDKPVVNLKFQRKKYKIQKERIKHWMSKPFLILYGKICREMKQLLL